MLVVLTTPNETGQSNYIDFVSQRRRFIIKMKRNLLENLNNKLIYLKRLLKKSKQQYKFIHYQFKYYKFFKEFRNILERKLSTRNHMSKGYKFQDFEILQTLDSTHEGKTKLYVVKYNDKIQVCKSISKSSFLDAKSVQHIKNQKQALLHFTKLSTSGINHIIETFQDTQNLYMLLELVEGLPLHKLLQMAGAFNEDFTRLIVTQVGLIMLEFHKNGYIYRDIKASNFMINSKGKVTMIDLGKAKHLNSQKTYTLCGTTHSMPPQVFEGKGYSYEFDYYSFGILIYQLLTGSAPFGYHQAFNEQYYNLIKQGVKQQQLNSIKDDATKDLIKKLLQVDIKTRLGSKNGFQQILEHEYFNCPQFCDYKDILDGCFELNKLDERFSFYLSQIQDFGLELVKYNTITQDDPFYKFYN